MNSFNIFKNLNESFEQELQEKRNKKAKAVVKTKPVKTTKKAIKEEVITARPRTNTKRQNKIVEDDTMDTLVNAVVEDMRTNNKTLKEDEVIKINETEPEVDYIINDVTVLDNIGDGDIQSPDIEALLTLVNESLNKKYGKGWGEIKLLSSNLKENKSFAIVDITTKELVEHFSNKGIDDVAIGKTLILENCKKGLVEFKVNNLNGTTKFSKKSNDPMLVIKEWVETEFLNEAKAEKEKEAEILKIKTMKETVENYLETHPEFRMEKADIEMFIQLGKSFEDESYKAMVQNRIYAFANKFPHNIEVENKEDKYTLKFNNTDEVVEMLFGKEWVKEVTPDNEVVGLNESYEQFNIGDIEVVFNPNTYETLYSIPSAEIEDKKINLTKVPSVDTPYDTETIIKQYIETRFGVIPTEQELKQSKEMGAEEVPTEEIPQEDGADEPVVNQTTSPNPTKDDIELQGNEEITEDELPKEPSDLDVGIDIDDTEDTDEEVEDIENKEKQDETGSTSFTKIRPKQSVSLEDVRETLLDGETPKSNYIVVDEIELSEDEFEDLTNNLAKSKEFLNGVQPIDRKNYSFNVVKVSAPNNQYDLLIDPLGYDYPRYVGVIDKV